MASLENIFTKSINTELADFLQSLTNLMVSIDIEESDFVVGSSIREIKSQISMFNYAFNLFDKDVVNSWFLKQYPKNAVLIKKFKVSKFLITNMQYSIYEKNVFGKSKLSNLDKLNHPVLNVSFYDACSFCQWLSYYTGVQFRLPKESEWEYIASSHGNTLFPWGNEFDPKLANTLEGGLGSTSEVGAYILGKSKDGIYDLAGNVEEWTSSIYLPYPGGRLIKDDIYIYNKGLYPVLRGGSYNHNADLCLAGRRHGYNPTNSISGFRIVC